jgi:hypothetical protein
VGRHAGHACAWGQSRDAESRCRAALGQLTIVGATGAGNGALVAPLFGLHARIGVLPPDPHGGVQPVTQAGD